MYKCEDCGAVFEDFAEYTIPGGCYESDYGVYSQFDSHNYYPETQYDGCPECGADKDRCYSVEECERCGAMVYELYDGLCEKCAEDN